MADIFVHSNNLNKDFKSKTYLTASLTNNQKQIYNILYQAIINLADNADFSKLSPVPTSSEVFDVHDQVLMDHPEIFYTSGWVSYSSSSKKAYIKYNDTKENIKPKINALNNKINSILKNYINSSMTALEKELAIHDYLVLNAKYDYENYKNGTIPEDSYNVYGTLIKGVAVCQGYAEAFKLLLNKVGIECIIVTSESMNHAWNIVTLGNNKYHVDVTWDDPVSDRPNTVRYNYFNVSDNTFKGSSLGSPHTWDTSKYPACTSTAYEYFTKMDYVQRSGKLIYYSERATFNLIRINVTGTGKTTLSTNRCLYLFLYNGWIYYSNYSNGGYLFRIKIDGSNNQKLNNVYCKYIYQSNGRIYYTNASTGAKESIAIPNFNKNDLNGDNVVNSRDLSLLISNYLKPSKSLNADSSQDIINDGIIDIYDISALSHNIK